MKPIIVFNNVNKKYGNITALNGAGFEIYNNERIGLVGNNGCGKTTTINIMCNLINYDSGEVYAFDKKVTDNYASYKSKLGIVLSEPYYIEDFSIDQYWKFVCKYHKVPVTEAQKRIDDLFQFLKLTEDKKKKIHQLSSGNKSKVSIGGALLHNPELLILDEPFINIDIETREQIKNLLKKVSHTKILFITSHDLDLVLDLCNKFLIMDKGRIIMEVNPGDFNNQVDLKNFIKKNLIKSGQGMEISWLK